MRLFRDDIEVIFREQQRLAERFISSESENYILTVNEETFIEHVVSSVQLDLPIIYWDKTTVDSYTKTFRESNRYSGERETYLIERHVFQYFVPVSGNRDLLGYHQARTIVISGFSCDADFSDGCMIIEFVQRGKEMAAITGQFERTKQGIIERYDKLVIDINKFNDNVEKFIRKKFKDRKDKILLRNDQLASLGVPIRSSSSPATFSIPRPEFRKKIIVRPIVTGEGFKPEPALSNEDYHQILKYISDVGKNFESRPSLYKGKREEHLRDHILMVLDPNFEMGSATGETFNKNGKTDIMLNYNGSVVFIAECKYWKGEKGYLATIDQLLSYLTWRNSKASVIVFVKQNNISSIIEKVKSATQRHSNYLGFIGGSDEAWFNYRMHLNGDKNREVKMAVQLFHLPS